MTHVCESVDEAVAGIADGSTVLIGGFGMAGMPVDLIDALIRQGATDLTVVSNNAGNGDTGLAALLGKNRVHRIVCSFPRQSDSWVFDGLYRSGRIELEVVPQGNLAERLRAAGAGIGAFYCPTGVGTPLAEGKETRVIDGRTYVLEHPIKGDVALVKAHVATGWETWSTARPPATSGRSWPPRPRPPFSRWARSSSPAASTRRSSSRQASSSTASSRSLPRKEPSRERADPRAPRTGTFGPERDRGARRP
jgi:3-oxoadipate CoA-transferase, alpha subunit